MGCVVQSGVVILLRNSLAADFEHKNQLTVCWCYKSLTESAHIRITKSSQCLTRYCICWQLLKSFAMPWLRTPLTLIVRWHLVSGKVLSQNLNTNIFQLSLTTGFRKYWINSCVEFIYGKMRYILESKRVSVDINLINTSSQYAVHIDVPIS